MEIKCSISWSLKKWTGIDQNKIIGCYLYLLMCEILMWYIFGAREIKTHSKKKWWEIFEEMKKISKKIKKIHNFGIKETGLFLFGITIWTGPRVPRHGPYHYHRFPLLKNLTFESTTSRRSPSSSSVRALALRVWRGQWRDTVHQDHVAHHPQDASPLFLLKSGAFENLI